MIILATALTLTGCINKDILISETPKDTFEAEVGHFENTKTSLDADNRIIWSADDEIMIFQGNESGNVYRLSEKAAGLCNGSFVAAGEVMTGKQFDCNIAVYPAGAVTGFSATDDQYKIGITIPETQTYRKASFTEDSFIMTAMTSSLNDKRLKFRKDADWSWNYGATFKDHHIAGEAYKTLAGGPNIVLPDKGTYDIYLSRFLDRYYIMNPGEKPTGNE